MKDQSLAIKKYLLTTISKHPRDIVLIATRHFKVTRTTIIRHLNTLIKAKKIIKTGQTKNVRYYLRNALNREMTYKISPELSEFTIFQTQLENILRPFPENIYNICFYGFTEIFNNAIDHSRGTQIQIKVTYESNIITLSINDNGIGIFKNIYEYFKLNDIRESILELTKGKVTTDPNHHSGEGIFFSSRAFDKFEIYANQLCFLKNNIENDWSLITVPDHRTGTKVIMSINKNSSHVLIDIFKKYQDEDTLAFNRSDIIVELAKTGEEILMSRSQAKRITLGLEKFNYITLDFSRIKLIGQGFVDEIFRVYQHSHPHIKFEYINANQDVEYMIKRGLANKKS